MLVWTYELDYDDTALLGALDYSLTCGFYNSQHSQSPTLQNRTWRSLLNIYLVENIKLCRYIVPLKQRSRASYNHSNWVIVYRLHVHIGTLNFNWRQLHPKTESYYSRLASTCGINHYHLSPSTNQLSQFYISCSATVPRKAPIPTLHYSFYLRIYTFSWCYNRASQVDSLFEVLSPIGSVYSIVVYSGQP